MGNIHLQHTGLQTGRVNSDPSLMVAHDPSSAPPCHLSVCFADTAGLGKFQYPLSQRKVDEYFLRIL